MKRNTSHRPAAAAARQPMPSTSSVTVVLRGLASFIVLVAIAVGVPLLLVSVVGSPLPSDGFRLSDAMSEFNRTGVADTTVMKFLSLVIWFAWARLVLSAVVDVAGRITRRPTRTVRGLGSSQRFAGHLIGSIVLMLSSFGARGVGASPLQPGVGQGVAIQESAPSFSAPPAGWSTTSTARFDSTASIDWSTEDSSISTASNWPTWTVKRNDSFWGIAESTLGDGMRWREIVAANVGREVSPGIVFEATTDAIQPGWVLAIPLETAAAAAPVDSARTIRVAAGDSLAHIAEAEYGEAALWTTVWEANRGRDFGGQTFDDPNLIHAGWDLVVPDDPADIHQPADAGSMVTPATPDLVPAADRPADLTPITLPVPITDRGFPAAKQQASTPYPSPAVSPKETSSSSISAESRGIDPLIQGATPACGPSIDSPESPVSPASPAESPRTTTRTSGGPSNIQFALMPAGLGGSLLAGGVITLVASKRRRQLQRATRGSEAVGLPQDLVAATRALAECAAPERLARLDAALRAAASQLADLPDRASVVAALVDPMGTIELAVVPPTSTDPLAPFTGDGGRWLLAPDVATAAIAPTDRRFAAFPNPGIVHVGHASDCEVYVDIEAVGMLSIDGRESSAILRSMVTGLAVSPFAELARLVRLEGAASTTGGEGDLHVGRGEPVESLDAALDLAAEAVAPILGQLNNNDTSAALRIRSSGEPWEPLILAAHAAAVPAESFGPLIELTSTAGRGLGIVTDAPINSPWCLVETPAGWVLDPLGWAVEPSGLSKGAACTLRHLIDHVSTPLDASGSTREAALADAEGSDRVDLSTADRVMACRPRDPLAWSIMVRMLGSVDAINVDGGCAEFEKSKSLELLTWLAEHRRTATRSGARGALWNNEVRDATFANVVSDARRSLARLLPSGPGDGGEWLGRTLTEQLTIHPLVVSDLDVIRDAIDRAKLVDDRSAVEVLRPAAELIRGVPFAGVAYLWADTEALGSNAALLAITVTTELAERALRSGDANTALWATSQGLVALPGHEELVGLRLRAHACRHDLVGLRQEWDQYERVLDADPWLDSEPSATLRDLRDSLLARLKSR